VVALHSMCCAPADVRLLAMQDFASLRPVFGRSLDLGVTGEVTDLTVVTAELTGRGVAVGLAVALGLAVAVATGVGVDTLLMASGGAEVAEVRSLLG
jgi:hypothetical protein